jgi:hypothetical protein
MSSRFFYRLIFISLLASSLLGGILILSREVGFAADAQNQPSVEHNRVNIFEEELNHDIFIPFLGKPWGKSIFGIELHSITVEGGLNQMRDTGAFWLRRNGLLWSDVEPTAGSRNWDTPSVLALEQELINANQSGMEVVLIVRSTPEWARENPELACGRIKIEDIPAFADFVREAVERYSKPPYNVRYWQIWNEPDAFQTKSEAPYGCWGDPNDDYYGGGYYASVLKQVYPQVKLANSQAYVVVGGLLLDCDPKDPPEGKDCKSSLYLEGILREPGARDNFDVISFHAYDYYFGDGSYSNPNWNSSWNSTGPVVIAKGNFIKDVLDEFGADEKLIFNSEGAIICGPPVRDPDFDPICMSEDFENTKAYYVAKIYAAAIATGLDANIWYSVTGWRYSGLLNKENLEPRLAYYAYQFARMKLGNAVFIEQDETLPNLFNYEFNRAGHEMHLVWSKDGSPQIVPVPDGGQVWDALGNSMPVLDGYVVVENNPYYIEYP